MIVKLCLLLCSILLPGQIVCHARSQTCVEQDDNLTKCTMDFQAIAMAADDNQLTCRAIEKFLQCVHEVRISCPENPLLQEGAFQDSVVDLEGAFNGHCPQTVGEMLCEYENLFVRFAPLCHPLINAVQPSTPFSVICENTRLYLQCLQRANAPCVDTERSLNRSISVVKTGFRAQCTEEDSQGNAEAAFDEVTRETGAIEDQMQGDAPLAEQPTTTPESEGQGSPDECDENVIGIRVGLCGRHILPTLGMSELNTTHVCKYSRRYLRCVRRLMNKCPTARSLEPTIYTPFLESMVNTCEADSFRCPFEVMEGDKTVLEYCTGNGHSFPIGSQEFCSYVSRVPKCLVRTKNKCRSRGFRNRDIRSSLIAVNTTLRRYCGEEVAKRSEVTDLEEQALEQQSNPVGQSVDEAYAEGNEVGQLQSIVQTLKSFH